MKTNNVVKIGICTDIHKDMMHDSEERLSVFLSDMKKKKVDFIIDLGDFCHPKEENKIFLDMWNKNEINKYHVLGNHDMDRCGKMEIMDFLKMKKNFYSFDFKAFHFIVLDTNYIEIDKNYFDYDKGNYFKYPKHRENINTEQLDFIKKDLKNTDKHTVIFSHASLVDENTGIRNKKDFLNIINNENMKSGHKKVICCFNGHDHLDYYNELNDVHYIGINSMSNHWMGSKYECIRFTKEIHDKYSSLKKIAPYKNPVYAVITLDIKGRITVDGKKSEFIGLSPSELGLKYKRGIEILPIIKSRNLYFKTAFR